MLLHPQFDPVAFSIGPLSVRWYGLMYLVAFVQFIVLGRYRIRTRPGLLTVGQLDDLLFYGMLGVIVGGRLGQVLFYEPGYYLAHPLEILAVWKGGMSFHGGFLGVLAAMGLWSRKHRIAWFDITDFIAPLVPLGLAAGPTPLSFTGPSPPGHHTASQTHRCSSTPSSTPSPSPSARCPSAGTG